MSVFFVLFRAFLRTLILAVVCFAVNPGSSEFPEKIHHGRPGDQRIRLAFIVGSSCQDVFRLFSRDKLEAVEDLRSFGAALGKMMAAVESCMDCQQSRAFVAESRCAEDKRRDEPDLIPFLQDKTRFLLQFPENGMDTGIFCLPVLFVDQTGRNAENVSACRITVFIKQQQSFLVTA